MSGAPSWSTDQKTETRESVVTLAQSPIRCLHVIRQPLLFAEVETPDRTPDARAQAETSQDTCWGVPSESEVEGDAFPADADA